jgi:hypothetical protein
MTNGLVHEILVKMQAHEGLKKVPKTKREEETHEEKSQEKSQEREREESSR